MKSKTINTNIFKSIIFAFVLMLGVVFGFSACGTNVGFDDGPTSTDVVIGNGTSALVYGNYAYYVNGYVANSDVGNTNTYGKVTYGAVYRTKLVNGKVVEKEKELDEDGNEKFDKTQAILNTGILVSKICGYEKTQLYIFDNYLYYTTPGNQVSKDGTIESDHIDFCRIKIDGHTRGEKLFTSSSTISSISYYMYKYNNKAYLVVKDGEVLKIGECTESNFKLETLDEGSYKIGSIAPTKYTRSNDVVDALDSAVYFTYTNDDIRDGNLLAKYDLSTRKITTLSNINENSFTLIASVGGKLYYNKKAFLAPGTSGEYLYYNTMGENYVATEKQLSFNAYTASNITPYNAESIGAFISDGSNVYKFNADGTQTKFIEGNATVIAQRGSYVFYTLNNVLYKKLISGTDAQEIVTLSSSDATKNTLSVVSGTQVFYLQEYTNTAGTSYYMHYIDTSLEEDDQMYNHFIGVLAEKDYLDEPTE